MFNNEFGKITLLTLLYCLQGVPLGLGLISIPFLLKKHLSYKELATFSLAAYPFSLKFLWSPLVDSYYFPSIGRRKSWIIPLQTLSGFLMIALSYQIEEMLLNAEYVVQLTCYMFIIILIYATQDIAVDGWAVELLSEQNKSLASSCQSIGMTIGYFLSFTFLLSLNSAEFCNAYIYKEPQIAGLVSVSGYLYCWGVLNLIISLYLVFYKEGPSENPMSPKEIYKQIFSLATGRNYKHLLCLLITCKIGTTASDSALGFVLHEKGLNESQLGLFALIMLPFDIIMCSLIGYYLNLQKPALNIYKLGFCLKVLSSVYGLFILSIFPEDGQVTLSFYCFLLLGNLLSSIAMNCTFVSICSFFNKIADVSMSGSILTFLNTVHNLGSSIPRYLIYQAIAYLTIPASCSESDPPICSPGLHGYYPVAYASLLFSVFYYFALSHLISKLSSFPVSSWHLTPTKSD